MDRADFAKFFAAVHDGQGPFKWQERLLDFVLDNGRWPDRIPAPTGAGKTSAIDVHVFAAALTAKTGPRLPRRLAMVVARRALVDDQYEHARMLAKRLADPGTDLIAEVAEELAGLAWPVGIPRTGQAPLVTARLRGGSVPSRAWRDNPLACAVLSATPDMWGSRLLFRGYGTPRRAAPREAGLLAFDSTVLVDEAHLARQLLETACQVARLAEVAEQPITGVPALQVTEVSATPATDSSRMAGREPTSVTVEDADLADERLAARLTRPKPVKLLPAEGWPSRSKSAANIASDAVMSILRPASPDDAAAHTVGCFTNTVPMAIAVARALRKRSLEGRAVRVVQVCGQVRPADLGRLTRRYPGIFTPAGNPEIDVIVATQSLEVGTDLGLAGIVTELASGTALAQRAGRVNRRGERGEAPVIVLVPDDDKTLAPPPNKAGADRPISGPYFRGELQEALAWVTARAADRDGLAPWALRKQPPPAARPRRTLCQRPELADAWHWARTGDDLAAEPELDLWLAESLERETSAGIVVRDALPDTPADAIELVRDIPPAPWEVFPVPYGTARAVLTELLAADRPMIRVRGGDVTLLRERSGPDGSPVADLRPGDIAVIDSSSQIFTPAAEGVFSPPVVVPAASPHDPDGIRRQGRAAADDVLHLQANPRPGSLVLRLDPSPEHDPVAGLDDGTTRRILGQFADGLEGRTERERRVLLARLLRTWPKDRIAGDTHMLLGAVIELLGKQIKHSDVIVRETGDGQIRVAVIDRRRAAADEELLQVFTTATGPVLLDPHQQAVAGRAELIARQLGLDTALTGALRVAGEHHDDGKADPRFQAIRLAAAPGAQLLAKSQPGSTARQVHERQGRPGLPRQWRHEQRSVADCWEAAHTVSGIDPLLAIRLVGTSHGHGRSGFPHTASELAGPGEPTGWLGVAASLFDEGGWDDLIEATHLRYGVWGCAFLEALLRAADCQVSGEGR